MTMTGSCLCRAVAYEVTAPLKFLGNCHCSMCRKAHGAAFATWGILEPGSFRWTAGAEFVERYESSPGNTRCFCRRCGASLLSEHGGEPGEVAAGTLDGDPGVRPREHIFVGSKAPWFEITDTLPQHAEWPAG